MPSSARILMIAAVIAVSHLSAAETTKDPVRPLTPPELALTLQKHPKRLGWFRRAVSFEAEIGLPLSSLGIPRASHEQPDAARRTEDSETAGVFDASNVHVGNMRSGLTGGRALRQYPAR